MSDPKKMVICSTCYLKYTDIIAYKMHLSSEYHLFNTKRKMAQMEPVSEDVFEQKKSCKLF